MPAPEQSFRAVRGVLLDASIPVVRLGTNGIASLESALEKNKGKETSWSHAQVAVPKDKLNLKGLGFEKTRLAIPLPGESWGTTSYRRGELHAHEAGPFLLVHKDESAPGKGLFAHLVHDVPTALQKRFSGKIAPFVQEKPMSKTAAHATDPFALLGGVVLGLGPGKHMAGETAAALAPQGRVGRSENVAKQLALLGAPIGSIVGGSGAPHLVAPLKKALSGTPTGRSIGNALEIGAPLIGGIGGGMLGGLATGGLVGGVQRLRGSLHKEAAEQVAEEIFLEEINKIADATFATSQYAGPMGGGSFQQASQLPAFRAPGLKTAIEKTQQKIAAPRVGKLPPVFSKEKGVLGRAKQLLSGERALALKTYKERYEGTAGKLEQKAKAHMNSGSPEYAQALQRDAAITGKAAKRIGKIHEAEHAKSTAARVGVVGAAGATGFAAGHAVGEDKEAGALTPAGRLVASQRKGTGMGASVSGPSIAEVAKPPRMGHAMPGALKNQV